ncbi:MAG: hypothetical protein JOZ72_07610 [Alphaproteobacteria bacterium]|nr:hypothetical protein [Alphaproteobacteria bacterium]
MRVAYLVHDLNDPAVARRLRMLRIGGMDAVVAGFWRGAPPPSEIAGAPAIALGQTFDARFAHRSLATLRQVLAPQALARRLGPVHVLMARNLEMLAVARALRRARGGNLPIAYEVLDIHRLLLSPGRAGRILRAVERGLMREADLLVTSSPAFQREYFEARQFSKHALPVALVENKLLFLNAAEQAESDPLDGPPWRIGWFGMIRCRRSFDILSRLARKRPDLVRIEIHGRPAAGVFGDLAREVAQVPAMTFGGAYAPADLGRLYRNVHFVWAIDYFEEGGNSEWLLPNRLYEGGSFNAVPLALRRTETGRWLDRLGLGVLMDDPARELESFLETVSPHAYLRMRDAARRAPRSAFVADRSDCERLVSILADRAA